MASETSSYASSCSQSNEAPKELLKLLEILNKKRQQQQQQQQQDIGQRQQQQLPQHCHTSDVNREEEATQQQEPEREQLQQSHWTQQKHRMELSQIELIYRAEGNANLVLALPQFKKVLRLPKIQQKRQQQQQQQEPQLELPHIELVEQQQPTNKQETPYSQKYSGQNKLQKELQQPQQPQLKQQQQQQQEQTKMTFTTAGQEQHQQQSHPTNAVGILTMDHYVAYIGIIRCLLGNEFVFEADIVAVPNPNDRDWINEHIRPYRPVNRLDKEFGGHYGLLLPDATQLPAEFDILFSNLQENKTKSVATESGAATQQCCRCCAHDDGDGNDGGGGGVGSANNNIFLEDTYAIEIKPKQGWLLPNNVNNLFDIKPTTAPAQTSADTTAAVTSTFSEGALKTSADKEYFTAAQNKPSTTKAFAAPTAATATSPSSPSSLGEGTTSSATVGGAATAPKDDKIAHTLHDEADIRCRYCSMQFLKLKQKKIIQRSNYCPIDLFSGVPTRMWNALHALFMCPQNNLRIFKNGIVVFDDQLSRLSKIEDLFPSDKLQLIKHLLVTCLLRDYEQKEQDTTASTANEDDDIVYESKTTTIAKEEEVKAAAATATQGDMTTAAADGRGDGWQPQHTSVTPCKKQKINICMETPTTVKAETEPESDVTKVNTTFTNTNTITTAKPTNTTTSTTTNTATVSTITDASESNDGDTPSPSCGDSSYCCPAASGDGRSDVSLGQMNTPEMPSLPKNCVLQKILHLQLLAKLNFPHMLRHKHQERREKFYVSLRKLLKKFPSKLEHKLEISQLDAEEQYLLAATALDCSIMITFRQIPLQGMECESFCLKRHLVCVNGQHFITKITLLDLDPKPDTHFAKYVKQTKEILQAIIQ